MSPGLEWTRVFNSDFTQTRPNFQNIGNSMLTMIRVFTGENWHEVMHAMSRTNHPFYQCIENPTYEDYVKNGH